MKAGKESKKEQWPILLLSLYIFCLARSKMLFD